MTAIFKKGFTLIELLVVIAILGVLAVVVLVAINPAQQLARTRDAGRISGVAQLGRSVEAYATNRQGDYPSVNGGADCNGSSWTDCLIANGDIQVVPSMIQYNIGGVSACNSSEVEGWCYKENSSGALVYSRLESDFNINKCAAGENAYIVYSTGNGRAGLYCGINEPSPGVLTFAE